MILFDSHTHTYTNSETNTEYISVTTLLGLYKNKFESDKHASRVASREGLTEEFVLNMWKDMNDAANEKGSRIHKIMEDYILNIPAVPSNSISKEREERYKKFLNILYDTYDKNTLDYIGKYNIKNTLSEVMLSDDDFEIAGMADIVYECKNGFYIGDFKTNKKFNFTNKYNERLKFPLEHLQECQFNTYALQLSIYAYMRERETGQQCHGLIIHYLEKDGWRPIHCNYLKTDVENLLKHYKSTLNS